jgi:hypothetical protein
METSVREPQTSEDRERVTARCGLVVVSVSRIRSRSHVEPLSRSEHRGRDEGAVRTIVRRDAVQDEVCAYLFQPNIFSTWLNKNKNMAWATFRQWKNFELMNSTTFVLFGKYCPIMDQLGSKDSSRHFQLNCVISYFLPTFTTSCMDPKIDVMKKVKKFQLLECI